MSSCNRLCPSVEGSGSPLITHRIGVDVCMARQRSFFHKCHRCVYRGQPANWEPAQPAMATIELPAVAAVAVKTVVMPKTDPKVVAKPAAPVAAKSKGKAKPAKPGKALEADG